MAMGFLGKVERCTAGSEMAEAPASVVAGASPHTVAVAPGERLSLLPPHPETKASLQSV